MSGKITRKFRLKNAQQFFEMFSEAQPTNLYFFIASPSAWSNEQNPPVPLDNVDSVDYGIWDTMIEAKKITASDISFGIKRNAWASNVVYTSYASNTELDEFFFVMTDEYQVYKCLENNDGALSTAKPTGKSSTPFRTNDGYLWKYMYSLTVAQALDFLTPTYIPVNTPVTDDGTDLWDIITAAKNGGIESYRITAGGNGYVQHTATLPTTASSTTITLASGASAVDDYYNNASVYIVSGTGAGQLRTITDYVGASRIATVNAVFSPVPDLSSTYLVSPSVVVTGNGINARAYSVVSAGNIEQINVIDAGSGYSVANVAIVGGAGSGATVSGNLSPVGGHGSNPTKELFGHNVILNVTLNETDSNSLKSNDYRIAGVIADPKSVATGNVANSDSYDQTVRLEITSPSGNFLPDETISGLTSGATGVFLEFRGEDEDVIALLKTSATNFADGESVVGSISGYSAVVTDVIAPELTKYTGEIVYFENNRPITRSTEQKESVKIVVKF